jgi:hypothetical protein
MAAAATRPAFSISRAAPAMSAVAARVRARSTEGTDGSIATARFQPSFSEKAMYQTTVSALRWSFLRESTSARGRSTDR